MFGQTAAHIVRQFNKNTKNTQDLENGHISGEVITLTTGQLTTGQEKQSFATRRAGAVAWLKSAADGSYLQTVSLQEIVSQSRVVDYHESQNPAKDVLKVAGLMVPIVALSLVAWAAVIGVTILAVITQA